MTNTYCELAVLYKKDFDQILKKNEEYKLIKEMTFFANLPFLKG